MSEINDGKNLKIIAFYLPQFHSIPENDQWWGKDFTEWTNVRKAEPLFEGHDQPRIPLFDEYNLLDDETKIWQANIAQKYGIYGFCYYHYWFKNGKMLLEKPAEQMLKNKDIDIPFCFSWANENWSKNWDGGNKEVIMEQDYGGQDDWEQHFQYLLPFFKDDRYITFNGKPLFIIYKPEQIIDLYKMTEYFQNRAIEEGLPGLCLAFQFPTYYQDMYYRDDIFDFRIGFEPVNARNLPTRSKTPLKVRILRRLFNEDVIVKYRKVKKSKRPFGIRNKIDHLTIYFYDEVWNNILTYKWTKDFIPGAFIDWDNTPRNKHGLLHLGFSIEKFQKYFSELVKRAKKEDKPVIFMNAWNEWAEGAFLEPDEKYQFQKLEAIQKALSEKNSNLNY